MADRTTNTFPEILNKFMGEIGKAKMLDDVGPPETTLLVNLENAIIQYRKAPVQDMVDQGQLPPDQGGGGPGGGGPSFLGSGGVNGVSMQPQIPPGALQALMAQQ